MPEIRREVLRLVKAKGFGELTPVQKKAIPRVLNNEDLLITAPTGFGKTEAAMIPVLSRLLDLHDKGERDGIQALYITPLKSLNRDMLDRLEFWCKMLGLRVSVRHGDTKQSERTRQRDSPPHILVTTPETLQSVLVAPKLKDSLSNVRFVIVDEVHELADSKRGVQLSMGLARLRLKSPEFQVIGLSATVSNKKEVARFLSKKCEVVEQGLGRRLNIRVEMPESDRPEFKGFGLKQDSRARLGLVVDLISKSRRTLVFVNTRFAAESLGHLLSRTEVRERVAVHHSSLSRDSRLEAEAEFKREASSLKAVVCTSSLELGIDIGEIDLVIQYNSPREVARLVQRVGRSGHRKHLIPKGVIIAGDELDCIESLVIRDKAIAGELEPASVRKNALDVAGHQLAGLALDLESIKLRDALKAFNYTSCFESLSLSELEAVARLMGNASCFDYDGETVRKNKRTKFYYYENVSTIRDVNKKWVRNAVDRKSVALLDESFVAEYLREGVSFIMRGSAWRVMAVTDEEVVVEPTQDLTAAIPEWVGQEIPVSIEVARAVENAFTKPPKAGKAMEERLSEFLSKQAKYFTPTKGKCFVEEGENYAVVHSFYGLKANEALARALSFLLSKRQRIPVRIKANAYGVLLEFNKRPRTRDIVNALNSLDANSLERLLVANLPNTRIYQRRLLGVAKAMGLVAKKAELHDFGLKRLASALEGTPAAEEALRETRFREVDSQALGKFLEETRFEEAPYSDSASPLAKEFFSYGSFSELITPGAPSEELVQAFKDNLMEKTQGLYCQYCNKTHTLSLNEAPSELKCPYCGSSQLTLKDFKQVLEKRAKKRRLTQEEYKELNEAYRVSNLISANGSRALYALNTFGVGPETAARLLSRMPKNEVEFYSALLDAQKNFIKTRSYWRI